MKNLSVAGVSVVVLIASIVFLARTSSVSVNAQPAAASPNVTFSGKLIADTSSVSPMAARESGLVREVQ